MKVGSGLNMSCDPKLLKYNVDKMGKPNSTPALTSFLLALPAGHYKVTVTKKRSRRNKTSQSMYNKASNNKHNTQ